MLIIITLIISSLNPSLSRVSDGSHSIITTILTSVGIIILTAISGILGNQVSRDPILRSRLAGALTQAGRAEAKSKSSLAFYRLC